MLYHALKPFVYTAVHIFYKKIEIANKERLNMPGPTLIVSNHNNAFLDALVVDIFARPKIYSIARGDVFKRPAIAWLLKKVGVIPIFRLSEGKDQMYKNEETFERCVELLGQKQHIIMYPEGDCVTEKRLRKLRKGSARIVLRAEAEHDFKLGVKVLPVGLNYSAAKNFRSSLFIQVGEPIYINAYQQQNVIDPVKTVNTLTNHIEKEMRLLIVDLHHKGDDRFYEDLLTVYKPVLMQKKGLNAYNLLHDYEVNKEIAQAVNYSGNHHNPNQDTFKQKIHQYVNTLSQLGITEQVFAKEHTQSPSMFTVIMERFLLGFGLPLHLAGIAFNYLPYRLAYNTADTKVKQVHFHASVNFVVGMFGWIFYYLFQLLLIRLYFDVKIVALMAVLIPASGYYSLQYYSRMKKAMARWRYFSLWQNNEDGVRKLAQRRTEIIQEAERLISARKEEKELIASENNQE